MFLCLKFGYIVQADVAGAINTKRAVHAQLAYQMNGAAIPSVISTNRSEFILTD